MTAIGLNLAADAIFAAILIFLGWVFFRITLRARLMSFFGIRVTRRVFVYLSHLRVLTPGGAIDPRGVPRSFTGSVVTFGETTAANLYRDLFHYPLPALLDKPGILTNVLVAGVQVEVQAAPLQASDVDATATIITLGSPGYNIVSDMVENQGARARFDLTGSPSTITVPGVSPISDVTYGFVERVVDHINHRSLFYCAGLSEIGSVGAAFYLATQWQRLWRQFRGDQNFLVMLKFDPADITRATVVFTL